MRYLRYIYLRPTQNILPVNNTVCIILKVHNTYGYFKYLPIEIILYYTLRSVLDHQSRVESIHTPKSVQGPGFKDERVPTKNNWFRLMASLKIIHIVFLDRSLWFNTQLLLQ